jgi:negative regulator of flagellin synthesis FlgM
MAMKIHDTPHNPSIRTGHGGDVREQKVDASEGHQPSGRANLGDTVSLTETASSLSTLIETLAQVPVVDRARVDELKAALSDGTFQIDANRIAEKLIRLEKDL